MNHYTLISTISMMIGWLVAMILHGFYSYSLHNKINPEDAQLISFWSFIITVVIANGIFIQWPEKYIVRFCKKSSFILFTITGSIYALAAFTLLIGWLFFLLNFGIVFGDGNIMFVDASVTGFIASSLFYILYRHSQKWTTSTTPS